LSKHLSVVHIVPRLRTGGLETLVLEFCALVQERNLATMSICSIWPDIGLGLRTPYRSVSKYWSGERGVRGVASRVLALAALLRRLHPDVVNTHNFEAQMHGAPAAALARVPVIVHTKHGQHLPRVLGSTWLAGRLYRLADTVVCVSQDVRQGFLAAYDFSPDRTRVILNGIDTGRFQPTVAAGEPARLHLLGCTGQPLIGTVCRMVGYKGVSTLLAAFRLVRERLPGATLVLVGDGPERCAFEAEARQLGLADAVRFLGNRDDVAAIYPLLDVFVLASYTEGTSLTLLEASACALPTVATAVGGNTEVVLDGVTGRLVPPRDASALAAAIVDIWSDGHRTRIMGAAARERVLRYYSLDHMAHEYIALYYELLEHKHERGRGKLSRF